MVFLNYKISLRTFISIFSHLIWINLPWQIYETKLYGSHISKYILFLYKLLLRYSMFNKLKIKVLMQLQNESLQKFIWFGVDLVLKNEYKKKLIKNHIIHILSEHYWNEIPYASKTTLLSYGTSWAVTSVSIVGY